MADKETEECIECAKLEERIDEMEKENNDLESANNEVTITVLR